MSPWITLRVLHSQTLKYESELDVLISEISLLQQYDGKADEDVEVPIGETGRTKKVTVSGHPSFCAVSVKSGLQFRVEETKEYIRSIVDEWDALCG